MTKALEFMEKARQPGHAQQRFHIHMPCTLLRRTQHRQVPLIRPAILPCLFGASGRLKLEESHFFPLFLAAGRNPKTTTRKASHKPLLYHTRWVFHSCASFSPHITRKHGTQARSFSSLSASGEAAGKNNSTAPTDPREATCVYNCQHCVVSWCLVSQSRALLASHRDCNKWPWLWCSSCSAGRCLCLSPSIHLLPGSNHLSHSHNRPPCEYAHDTDMAPQKETEQPLLDRNSAEDKKKEEVRGVAR